MTLAEALQEARASAALKEVLPPEFVDNMAFIAEFENRVFETRVNDLERRRYLEMA